VCVYVFGWLYNMCIDQQVDFIHQVEEQTFYIYRVIDGGKEG